MAKTTTIDDKKKQNLTGQSTDFYSFFLIIFIRIIVIGLLILLGALCLYSGKVAQTNIMPTCLSYAPYTDIIPPIKQAIVDINVVKTDKGNYSSKIVFPLEPNFKIINNTLEFLKTWMSGPNSSVIKLYIATTLQQILSCNFTINNTINNFMNSMLSETWYLILAPYVLFFSSMLTCTVNAFYMIILWFYNITLLFSEKITSGNKTEWKSGSMFTPFNIGWAALYIFILSIIFFTVGVGLIIPLTAFIVSMFCIIFPLFMKSKNSETGKDYGIGETIKNILKYKLNVIMIILSVYIILSASSSFGGYAAFVAVVVCILLYFFTSVYHQYIPTSGDHATNWNSIYAQADKVCTAAVIAEPEETMFQRIGNLFGGSKRGRK